MIKDKNFLIKILNRFGYLVICTNHKYKAGDKVEFDDEGKKFLLCVIEEATKEDWLAQDPVISQKLPYFYKVISD